MEHQATRILNAQPSRKEGLLALHGEESFKMRYCFIRCEAVEAVFFATTPWGTEA